MIVMTCTRASTRFLPAVIREHGGAHQLVVKTSEGKAAKKWA